MRKARNKNLSFGRKKKPEFHEDFSWDSGFFFHFGSNKVGSYLGDSSSLLGFELLNLEVQSVTKQKNATQTCFDVMQARYDEKIVRKSRDKNLSFWSDKNVEKSRGERLFSTFFGLVTLGQTKWGRISVTRHHYWGLNY